MLNLMLLQGGFLDTFTTRFYNAFIAKDRWQFLLEGLLNTLKITVFALLIGIVIGFIVAIVRSTHQMTGKFKILNFIFGIYLTIIRGTPVVVQLLIINFIVFASYNNKVLAGILCFGINSGAYVAEIFRSGIMSIDKGQMEAGRSLGFNYFQTMIIVIMPQAIKNVIPALANEMVVLVKETAVSGYIAIQDLTKGGDIIRSQTYDAFFPLFGVALIYLVITVVMTTIIGRFERRLRNSDH